MIDRDFAVAFAEEWTSAWNAHDLERVLAHYRDDFVMSSPFGGCSSGQAALPCCIAARQGSSPLKR